MLDMKFLHALDIANIHCCILLETKLTQHNTKHYSATYTLWTQNITLVISQ